MDEERKIVFVNNNGDGNISTGRAIYAHEERSHSRVRAVIRPDGAIEVWAGNPRFWRTVCVVPTDMSLHERKEIVLNLLRLRLDDGP